MNEAPVSNIVMIAITEARDAVQRAVAVDPELSIEDRLREAFRVTRNHWIATKEDDRFKAGVGGVILAATEEERERINHELRALQMVGAMIEGIPVNFEAAYAEAEQARPIGLLRIWREEPMG